MTCSFGGKETARISIFVVRVVRLMAAAGRLTSVISAWVRVDSGQLVTALVTTRNSRSASSKWEGEVSGSHAAASIPETTVCRRCSRSSQERPVSFCGCTVRWRPCGTVLREVK